MAAGPAQVAAGQSTLPERPNIIFIMLDDIDGVSVVPSLLSKPQAELRERPLYWEFHKGNFQQAARLGDWKAVRGAPDKPIELYHLAQDIAERDNIADDHPDQVAWFERFLSKAPFLLT